MPNRSVSGIIRRCVLLGLGLSLILTAGCMMQPRPFVAPLAVTAPSDLSFVIPSGTASADMRGEPSFKIPEEIVVQTGQSVVIRNDDHAMHYFAETPIAPGQTYRKVFGRPGAFGYGGVLSCSIAERKTVTVRVVDHLPDGAPNMSAPTAPR